MGAQLERFLIVHEDAPAAARISADLEGEVLAHFEISHGLTQAIKALKANTYSGVIIHWRFPQHAALFIFDLLPTPLPVFAFAEAFTERDLARALQLGVSGLFFGLPTGKALSRELDGLLGRVYPSIRQLISERGSHFYQPRPELWRISPDDALVQRLEQRAQRHQRGCSHYEQVARLIQLLTHLDARAPSVKILKALRLLTEGHAPQEVSERTGLGVTRLRRLFRAVGQGGASNDRLTTLLEEASAISQARVYSPGFKALRLAAAAQILGVSDDLRAVLFSHLGVDEAEAAYVDEGRVYLIASQIVAERDERAALHIARFILLNEALNRVATFGLDKPTFGFIGRLLGCDADSDLELMGLRAAACLLDDESAYTGFKRFPLASINKLLALIASKGVPSPFNPIALSKRLTQAIEIALTDGCVSRFRLSRIIDLIERGAEIEMRAPTREAISYNLSLSASQRGSDTNLLWQSLGVLHPEQEARIRAHLDGLTTQSSFSTLTFGALIKAAQDEETFASWTPPRSARLADPEGAEREAAIRVRLVEGFDLDPDLLDVLSFDAAARHNDAEEGLVEACVSLLSADIREAQREMICAQVLKGRGRDPQFLLRLQSRLGSADEGLRAWLRGQLQLTPDLATVRELEQLLEAEQIPGVILGLDEISDEDPKVVPLLNKLALALEAERPDAAVAYYERALSIQPKRLNLQLNLARSKVKQGDYQGARALLLKIAQSNPGFGDSNALMKIVNQRS